MNYAFDWGGTLCTNADAGAINVPLVNLARCLSASNNEVHLISACDPQQESAISDHVIGMGIDWASINFVRHGSTEQETGENKARVMHKITACILFDDNPHVVRMVRAAGFQAFQVK